MYTQKILAVAFTTICAAAFTTTVNAEQYTISPKSAIQLTSSGLTDHTSRFEKFSGNADIDPDKLDNLKINATVEADSLNAGIRSFALKGDSVLATKKYPKIYLKSTKVKVVDGKVTEIYGDLTMRGITQNVKFNVVKFNLGTNPEIRAKSTVDRSKWGASGFSSLASLNVVLDFDIKFTPTK